ncbi:hypothetical protein [Breoghania sp.]|uniref:hypothetical protein n=1 Tax=Breoghania sp. TaxID=2065378 RepID=UPI00262FC837|nr:hypothetical protein [Breoghania sp.]MDJ0930987.1 hypothetical protein [Breoghania sp.]
MLTAQGTVLDRLPFEGDVDYISNPTLSIVPISAINGIMAWMGEHFPVSPRSADAPSPSQLPASLQEEHYK